MSSADVVRRMIAEQSGASIERVVPGASLKRDLGADSLDVVELAFNLEDELAIYIDDAQIERFVTVKDVIDFVDETKREKGL